MADAFDEVEENYRREQLARVARKYWPVGAGLLVAVLLGFIGYELYNNWSRDRASEAALGLTAARELAQKGDLEAAAASFEDVARSAPAGYRTVAHFERAGALMLLGKREEAIAAFEAAAKSAPDPIMRDAARLQAAFAAADAEDLAAIEARVKPLVDDAGPWSFQARELIAMEAMSEGATERARTEFQYLSLQLDAPEGVRQRAGAALGFLGPAPAPAAAGAAAGAATPEPSAAPASAPPATGAPR